MNKVFFGAHVIFHPGYYVQEIIDDLGVERPEFSKRLCISDELLDDLISGDIDLSEELAARLCKETNISVRTWMNMQKCYTRRMEETASRKELVS